MNKNGESDAVPQPESGEDTPRDQEFRFALEALLAAYEPILSEELKLAKSPDKVREGGDGPDCEAEITLANQIFGKFWSEKVAVSILPAEAREKLGPVEKWRWCFLHIRCCMIFGWLVCHGPRGIRGYSYYLNRYWRCVREVLGRPVSNPLTAAEAKDFQTLVGALAEAYRPYLHEQLSAADSADLIATDVISGKIDCDADTDDAVNVFERMLTAETAAAMLGEEALATHRQDPFFWFCRCWCLCAIRFGCCLARARRIPDLYRCLKFYRNCLRQCSRPLVCDLTGPKGCVDEITIKALPGFLVPVTGTAGGAGFSHYVLEWSTNDITYHTTSFYYPPIPPGNTVQGNSPVFGGLFGYFDTTFQNPGLQFIRLTVFSVTGAQCVKKISFELSKNDVRILGVGGYFNLDTGWADPAARFVETVPALCTRPVSISEVSFGGCLAVSGGAFIGGCESKIVDRYTLDYKPGFETNCASAGWTQFWEVDYTTPAQKRFINWRTDSSVLTSDWVDDCFVPTLVPPFCSPFRKTEPLSLLSPDCWKTLVAACELSGLYTLRLTVHATDGSTQCDTQRVWLDNKDICVRIQIDAVPKCADLFVSKFAQPPDCSIPWKLPVSGIAYDPYIDPLLPHARPNDNFDYYTVTVTKQGGPSLQIPVPGPGGSCFYGTSRVGSCTQCPGDPPGGDIFGTLTTFDLRAVDVICSPSLPYSVPVGFGLKRGECCVYVFEVYGQDRTITSGGPHHHTDIWPVKICNDLKP
jgi:hypothetical protein